MISGKLGKMPKPTFRKLMSPVRVIYSGPVTVTSFEALVASKVTHLEDRHLVAAVGLGLRGASCGCYRCLLFRLSFFPPYEEWANV